jgi:predicted permease
MSPITASVRHLFRRQRRAYGATVFIVLTLALALGANTTIFSVADALLLRAVPYRDADRLVAVTTSFPAIKLTGMNLSGPEAQEFGQLTTAFAASGPFAFVGLVVQGNSEAELANGVEISQGAIDALGLRPFAGRTFADHEFHAGGRVVLIGEGLWKRAFAADPSLVGRTIELGGVSRQVIGIVSHRSTLLNRRIDVWLPLSTRPADLGGRADHRFNVVARLADGRSLDLAMADVRRAMEIWREETGEMHTPSARMHPLELQPLARATTGLNREPIVALLAAVGFVLLIACANISNLLVVRAESRRTELDVQLALGATRRRILVDSLGEGLLLASAGGLGGLLLAELAIDSLRAAWPAAAVADVTLDYRVLVAAVAATVATGAAIGIAPVLRLDLSRMDGLKSSARGSVGGGRLRLQQSLIALQIALAVLLSGCAGLMVRSLLALTRVTTGIDTTNVLRAQISLPAGSYPDDGQVWGFYDRVLDRLQSSPGVAHAAVMSGLPPERRANNTSFLLDGVETIDHTTIHQIEFVQHASPGYLATLGIRLLHGRDFTAADNQRSLPVALVNATLASQFWPNDSAIGHRLKPAGNIGTWFTIVGVVDDVRQNGLQSPPGSEIYVPYRQARLLMSGYMPRTMNVVLKTNADVAGAAALGRSAVRLADPSAAVSAIAAMDEIIGRTIARPRLLAWMFGGFAILAITVAGLGVYGVTSYAVGTRTAEFGVRMALGARPSDLFRLVLVGGTLPVAAGVAAGLAATIVVTRLLRNLLFAVEPQDPASIAAGTMVIAAAAVAATLLPARRAARVDPLAALRD